MRQTIRRATVAAATSLVLVLGAAPGLAAGGAPPGGGGGGGDDPGSLYSDLVRILRDEHGDFFAGSVVDVDERRYLVHLGVRLPEEYAMLRLGRRRPGSSGGDARPGDEDVQSVLDLIGEARDALGGRMPSQRTASDLF